MLIGLRNNFRRDDEIAIALDDETGFLKQGKASCVPFCCGDILRKGVELAFRYSVMPGQNFE